MNKRINIPEWKDRKLCKLFFTCVLLIITLCLSLALAVPATAATTVVAEFTDVSGLYETISSGQYAQTFITGPTDTHANAVQLKLVGNQWQTPATIRVSLTETTSSLPNGSEVCSGTLTRAFYNEIGWYQISLGNGASLAANTKYALVVTADPCPGYIDWQGRYVADYSGGTAYVYSDSQWATLPIWSTNHAALGFRVLNVLPDYPLTVATNPAGIGSTTGSGSHEAGAAVSIGAPHIADYSGSTYHFNGWTGAAVADASSNETTMTMPASATTVTASYVAQYTYDNFTNQSGPPYGFDDWWHAQTFTTNSVHNVNAVSLYMYRRSSFSGTMTVSIRSTDINGCPTGADLVSGTIDVSNIPVSPVSWVLIPMSGSCTLDTNTKYAVQVRATGGPGYIFWISGGSYSSGQAWFAQLNGTYWQTWSDLDFLFKIWGDPPQNVPPVASASTITATEDTDYHFAAANFSFTDTDEDTLTDVEITALPPNDKGTLKLSGGDVTAGQQIETADIPNLVYQAPLNQNGNAYTSFTFKVKAGPTWSESAATMTINVNAIDDPPVATNHTITALEDTNYTFAANNFQFTDVENSSCTDVEITTVPGKGTLNLSGSDVAAGVQIAAANIPNLKYKAAADENGAGYTSFTFKVKAGGAWSESAATMTINVTPVNDAPVIGIGTLTSQTIEYSDEIMAGTISVSDIDSPYTALSVTGLPDGLAVVEASHGGAGTLADPATISWNISGIITDRARNYPISVTDASTSMATGLTITIKQEKVLIRYDIHNLNSVAIADAGIIADSVFKVYLRQEADGHLGTQAISARNTNMMLVPVSGGNPIGMRLVGEPSFANFTTGGEVELSFKTIDNPQVFGVDTYIVLVRVVGIGSYYRGVGGEDLLAVFDPKAGTQGQGSFYWPGTTNLTDFAFTVQYNKSTRNLQGSFIAIRHLADGEVYRIKSNALYNLVQNGNKASFAGKCTYIGPDSVLDADGNLVNEGGKEFLVYVEDNSNPSSASSPDKFWFTVFEKAFRLDSDMNNQADADELISIPETNSSGEIIVPYTAPGKK